MAFTAASGSPCCGPHCWRRYWEASVLRSTARAAPHNHIVTATVAISRQQRPKFAIGSGQVLKLLNYHLRFVLERNLGVAERAKIHVGGLLAGSRDARGKDVSCEGSGR